MSKKYYMGDKPKNLPKQQLHFQNVPHEGTLLSAIKWWLLNRNKYCHSFCPTCEYYFRCQEDVAMEQEFDDVSSGQFLHKRTENKFWR